jgi:hypothetical protein
MAALAGAIPRSRAALLRVEGINQAQAAAYGPLIIQVRCCVGWGGVRWGEVGCGAVRPVHTVNRNVGEYRK